MFEDLLLQTAEHNQTIMVFFLIIFERFNGESRKVMKY